MPDATPPPNSTTYVKGHYDKNGRWVSGHDRTFTRTYPNSHESPLNRAAKWQRLRNNWIDVAFLAGNAAALVAQLIFQTIQTGSILTVAALSYVAVLAARLHKYNQARLAAMERPTASSTRRTSSTRTAGSRSKSTSGRARTTRSRTTRTKGTGRTKSTGRRR